MTGTRSPFYRFGKSWVSPILTPPDFVSSAFLFLAFDNDIIIIIIGTYEIYQNESDKSQQIY